MNQTWPQTRLVQREQVDFLIRELGNRHLLDATILAYLRQAIDTDEDNTIPLNLAKGQAERVVGGLAALFMEIGLQGDEPNVMDLYIEDLIDVFKPLSGRREA